MEPLYLMAIGAGLKGTAVGFLKQALGGVMGGGLAGISDDILAIGVGYLIKEKASGDFKDVGAGIFIAGIAGIVEGVVGGMPILGGRPAAGGPVGGLSLEQEAAMM